MLRDGLPLSRPTRWAGGKQPGPWEKMGDMATWKLFPGAANTGQTMAVSVMHCGMIAPMWVGVQAMLSIDGIMWPHPMPGRVYVDRVVQWAYGDWSCAIHFPVVSDLPTFAGNHTLLLRTVTA